MMKTFEVILENEETKERMLVQEKGWDAEDMLATLSEKYGLTYIIIRVIPADCEDEEDRFVELADDLLANDKPWNMVESRYTDNIVDYGDLDDLVSESEEDYVD